MPPSPGASAFLDGLPEFGYVEGQTIDIGVDVLLPDSANPEYRGIPAGAARGAWVSIRNWPASITPARHASVHASCLREVG